VSLHLDSSLQNQDPEVSVETECALDCVAARLMTGLSTPSTVQAVSLPPQFGSPDSRSGGIIGDGIQVMSCCCETGDRISLMVQTGSLLLVSNPRWRWLGI
jgi:hypothetical protein